jgi:DNA-directed RNA polymerase subunit K
MASESQPKSPEDYTRYEKARMIGSRALQIGMGAPFLIKVEEEQLKQLRFDPIRIAELEFNEGVLPITVRRPLPRQLLKKGEK